MRAVAVFPEEKRLAVIACDEPRLERAGDALVRILDVGVCGTDREIARFEYGAPPRGESHLIIGHESFAQVVETGAEVEGVEPGDLVVLTVRRPCLHAGCEPCRLGRQDFCRTGEFSERGIKGLHGYMTELVVDDARYLHPVPAPLRDVGVLVEPLTIAEKALTQVWDVQKRLPWSASGRAGASSLGQRAVVIGAGPVGLLGALALI